MLRYLGAAFWSRPQLPLLRYFPWNALLVAGSAVAGWFDPTIWLVAGAFETLYLSTIATNPQFQRSIDARSDVQPSPEETLRTLGGAARQRAIKIEQKLKKLDEKKSDDLMFDSNRMALRQLAALHLRLLVAQRDLLAMRAYDADELRKRIAALDEELKSATESVRDSKQATRDLLVQRVRNFERRDEALREVESDLARIEAQIDVAVEQAAMQDHPVAISTNVGLVSRLIEDTSTTTTSSAAELER